MKLRLLHVTSVSAPKEPGEVVTAPPAREKDRAEEHPSQDVSLEHLEQVLDFLTVLPPLVLEPDETLSLEQVRARQPDVLVTGRVTADQIQALWSLGKPLLPEWDAWGRCWSARYLPGGREPYSFIPVKSQEVRFLLTGAWLAKGLAELKILVLGELPEAGTHGASDLAGLEDRFGFHIEQLSLHDYLARVNQIPHEEGELQASKWQERFSVRDRRSEKLSFYARIYLALKALLEERGAGGACINCEGLVDKEYVPCLAASLLIEEGKAWGCQCDLAAVLATAILGKAAGGPVFLGDLFHNNTERDLEENVVSLNSDLVAPGLAYARSRPELHDWHGTELGITCYAGLRTGAPVTLFGVRPKGESLEYIKGELAWTQDTVSCRTAVGVKVADAPRLLREAECHHYALAYGDHLGPLEMLAQLTGCRLAVF